MAVAMWEVVRNGLRVRMTKWTRGLMSPFHAATRPLRYVAQIATGSDPVRDRNLHPTNGGPKTPLNPGIGWDGK